MNEYFGNQVLDGEWHARLPRYLLLADRIREQRVLDLGCSSGIGASLLVELGAERVDAVDPRPESLDLARIKHDKAELDFHRMAWEELEFPDGTFDCVVSLDPSNPVTAPVVLDEIDRVLAPEGEYVCAIERRTVHGMESLLPREDATRVEVGTGNSTPGEKTPQIGQLQRRFGSVVRTRQTPTYGYTFDAVEGDQTTSPPAETDEPNDASSEAEPGNGHEGPTAAEPEETIERSLGSSDESSGVEIIFCGDDVDAPVPHRIDLPYYALVDRIRNHLEHTRNKPVRGSRGPQTPADRRPNEPELDERLALVAETYRAVR
ncbi:MAG: class I SAM-dependent methyltransferase, partial [Bradymonadaceae bacterium]